MTSQKILWFKHVQDVLAGHFSQRAMRLEVLLPWKSHQIAWVYVFIPALVAYVVFLQQYVSGKPQFGNVERFDAMMDKLVAPGVQMEQLATGFLWIEGPLWVEDAEASKRYLLFSDTLAGRIWRWEEGGGPFTIGKSLYLSHAGCTRGSLHCQLVREPGSNALIAFPFESHPRDIVACQHGDRNVVLLRKDGSKVVLVDSHKGKRLNSPNDAVFSAEGDLYFTDPPYGIMSKNDKSLFIDKQIEVNGVYRISKRQVLAAVENGTVAEPELLVADMTRPNGLAFSPDYSKLYIANSDRNDNHWRVYDVSENGGLANGRVFVRAQDLDIESKGWHVQSADGLKVDIHGNVWSSSPGGVVILSPQGTLLGVLNTLGKPVSNVAFGADDRLYITANDTLLRIKVEAKPAPVPIMKR